MTYIDDCKAQFNSLPAEIRSRLRSPEAVAVTTKIEEQYQIDVNFLIILVMIGQLAMADIPEYLIKKYHLGQAEVASIKKELVNRVFRQILDKEDLASLDPVKQIKETLYSNVVETLEGDADRKVEINEKILYLFATTDLLNQEELVKILEANQEILTSRQFILDRRVSPATVANWIKDFIKYHGVMIFDNVILSRYITSSQNTRILDEVERARVRKLLQLYRNIKFFPESMSDRAEDWEIFPLEKEEVLAKAKTVSAPRIEAATARKLYPVVKEKQAPRVEAMIPKKVSKAVKEKPAPPPSLAKAFYEYEKFQEQILKKEDELMVKTQGNTDRIKRELANAARGGDKNILVACLKILARDGSLKTVLASQMAWFEATAESMRKKYKAQYSEPVVEQMVTDAKLNPASMPVLSEFLQYLLKERARMDENESALVGLDIGQAMEGERQRLAYGHEEKGIFAWVANKIKDGKLVSELD